MTEEKPLTRKEVIDIVVERMRAVSARTHASMAQQVFQHQADATKTQANPVSETWYEVLATTKNVRLISAQIKATYTGTDDANDNIALKITIDGQTLTLTIPGTDLASATSYYVVFDLDLITLHYTTTESQVYGRSFFMEGRSVKVEARVVDGGVSDVTFTELASRVKYAKIP